MKIVDIKDAYEQEQRYIEGRKQGIIKSLATPWKSWNDIYMDGFELGWIISVAGLSGGGKTTILNSLETGFFDCNPGLDIEVLNFNFEMISRRLIGRKLSNKLGLSVKELYSTGGYSIPDHLIQKIDGNLKSEITKYNISYVEFPNTPAGMKETILEFIKLKKIQERGAILIVTLDHTDLVKRALNKDDRQTIHELMSVFNELKKYYQKSLFIVISQLNRNIEAPERKVTKGAQSILNYPQKSDIWASEAVYTFSDASIIIHRPELLNLNTYGPTAEITRDVTFCHHLKNRDGTPTITRFKNDLAKNQFNEYIK